MRKRKRYNVMDIEELKRELRYDANSGVFYWISNKRGLRAGDIAGYVRQDGYWQLCINRTRVLAHRAAWAYVNGMWPDDEIDHIDLDKTNNAIKNLRQASHQENSYNRNATGVSWKKSLGKYSVEITANGRRVFRAYCVTLEEGKALYREKIKEYHGDFARTE
jgi:HNH endonuclease